MGDWIDLAVGIELPGLTRRAAGGEVIVGTDGDDTLIASFGANRLAGGAGGDRFVYSSLHDVDDIITDFTPYADICSSR